MEPKGTVLTPSRWARFVVDRSGALPHWLAGGTVLDPTLGTGNLLLALVERALEAGHPASTLPFHRLRGVEIRPESHALAVAAFQNRFGVDMSRGFLCGDVFEVDLEPASLVLGNPPWINFSDLDPEVKALYKARFVQHGLVSDTRALLWGGARMDVAALVVQRVMGDLLHAGGEAWFFLPLSLFLNDGAHAAFRSYRARGVPFAVEDIYDGETSLFPGVTTRHGLVHLRKGSRTQYPIAYWERRGDGWSRLDATPALGEGAPLSVVGPGQQPLWADWTPPLLKPNQHPRQGLNTGGANDVFFFRSWEAVGDLCRVDGHRLPRRLVHPLATAKTLRDPESRPERWVLLPYENGRPMTPEAVAQEPLLERYLAQHRDRLQARKGVLLASWRRRGVWWAVLGVGPYSFAPYKVVWQAYGSVRFEPVVLAGEWQTNQALQASIPCESKEEAESLRISLSHPAVRDYLASTRMAGTKSWAQPGRLRRLLLGRS